MKLDPRALAKVNRAIAASFEKTVEAYAEECTQAIESEIWQWDGYTLRKNGELVGSPRDIVDTGELRDSQEVSFPDDETGMVEYIAEHAANVHEGLDDNGNPRPARPWMEYAAANMDFEGTMADELRKLL